MGTLGRPMSSWTAIGWSVLHTIFMIRLSKASKQNLIKQLVANITRLNEGWIVNKYSGCISAVSLEFPAWLAMLSYQLGNEKWEFVLTENQYFLNVWSFLCIFMLKFTEHDCVYLILHVFIFDFNKIIRHFSFSFVTSFTV